MKAISFKHFSGRNIYCHKECIRMDVNLEGFKDIPSKNIKGFNENLIKLVPILKEHRCGIDEKGGCVKRLEEGTYLAYGQRDQRRHAHQPVVDPDQLVALEGGEGQLGARVRGSAGL